MKIRLGLEKMSMSDACRYCDGKLFGAAEHTFEYICTDSREADENTLFVATRGERVDGHSFIASAQAQRCRCFLCERIPEGVDGTSAFCVTQNSLEAFGALARGYRSGRELDSVAITGSVGKTTTKELTSLVLAEKYSLYRTEGNFNSIIGMPMSMMEVGADVSTAVFEMGMSGSGEISLMSRTARPRVALITNIGSSHLEYLGTRENIAKSKFEIAEGLREGGILLLNGDEPLLRELAGKLGGDRRVLFVSLEGNGDFCAENIRLTPEGSLFDMRCGEELIADIYVPAIGRHIVFDALFAAAVGLIFGLSSEQIRAGLSKYISGGYRQKMLEWNGKRIIADCYNASPESVRSALDVLCSVKAERRIAVLGDMKELGQGEIQLHRGIGEYVVKSGIDVLITVGELARSISERAKELGMSEERIFVAVSCEDAAKIINELSSEGDVLLFKASRSMRFEKIIEQLQGAN